MAAPISGTWSASYGAASQYSGTTRWGTGSNPVKEHYGEGPPLRSTGRLPGPDMPGDQLSDIPESFESPDLYGYTMEDIPSGEYYGMPPSVGTETSEFRGATHSMPDWEGRPEDPAQVMFRHDPRIDDRLWQGYQVKDFPTETVSEGWLNKETGSVLAARTSDPAQYERQTSMQQLDPVAGRNNDKALARNTDDPRFNIRTRLTGMKIKPWSGGERHADMFPYQQDLILRPFHYRTAGTGDPADMATNAMRVRDPIQRDVPDDPSLGVTETQITTDYGYTDEDISAY